VVLHPAISASRLGTAESRAVARALLSSGARTGWGGTAMVRAFVLITATSGKALEVVHRLSGAPGVLHADAITGEYDVIAEVEAGDIAGIGRLVVERVQATGVLKTITCLVVQ
jgi:DNA-binding Lrp family transcriptional regulator